MISEVNTAPLAASHPDHPIMSREELLEHVSKISQSIERCGASIELTNAVTLTTDLRFHLLRHLDQYEENVR